MSLCIKSIQFRNFRNYESLELEDIGALSVFVGENAIGKTNIIEGIQLLTALSSFRHPKTEYLIREGAQAASIEHIARDGVRDLHLRLDISEGTKTYSLNGKRKRAAEIKGLLPSVVFTPDDLLLVKGSNSGRRASIDSLGSQLSKNHYILTKDYEKVLRHKNKLLKDGAETILLENINDMMVTCGAQLTWYRAALVAKMAPYIQNFYRELCNGKETLEIRYIPSWEDEADIDGCTYVDFSRDEAREKIYTALSRAFYREQEARRSLVGPHADKIVFLIDEKNASLFGSQGQQRSIVLAYKLAELFLIQDTVEQKPVLLLDDVMSELDSARRSRFISFIANDIQTFITTTHLDYFKKSFLENVDPVYLPL